MGPRQHAVSASKSMDLVGTKTLPPMFKHLHFLFERIPPTTEKPCGLANWMHIFESGEASMIQFLSTQFSRLD